MHTLAQQLVPAARVVYVEYDPVVSLHVGDLLGSTSGGEATLLEADLREAGPVLDRAAATLDLTQPTAVLFSDVLGHVHDDAQVQQLITTYMQAVPAGSFLFLTHATPVASEPRLQELLDATGAVPRYLLRSPETVRGFFDGLELQEPGLVRQYDWRPASGTSRGPATAGLASLAGLARKMPED
ncbi:SAM-dependent methyltransferase [Streptomyces sp. GKU 257-1]|nr:SAM-dependent methyltransferase [Streptomyces sp. GKU 257-1]